MPRRFVVVTSDTSGLGFAVRLQEEGESVVLLKSAGPEEDDMKAFRRVGKGLVPIQEFTEQSVQALMGKETYWIFDRNILPEVADALRKAGQKVWGTSALTEKMEHDRAYAIKIAASCGLPSPPLHEFKTVKDGQAFLEQHDRQAFVLKPNAADESYTTFVPFRDDPQDANHELLCYLRHCGEMTNGYILQERKAGIEVNAEAWFFEGVPFFAFGGLENKRKWTGDLSEMSGCAGDIVWALDLASPLVTRTIAKMYPFYRDRRYTGPADVNVILGDNETWFLEVCDRAGFNATPNLFWTCALDSFGNLMADWMDGTTKTIPSRFRSGFGASITTFIDHKRAGLPLHLNPRHAHAFYFFDGMQEGDDMLLTGYGQEIGIFTHHDYTIEDAAQECLDRLWHSEAVSYPDIAYRTDLHKTDYRGSPVKRHAALRSLGLLS